MLKAFGDASDAGKVKRVDLGKLLHHFRVIYVKLLL